MEPEGPDATSTDPSATLAPMATTLELDGQHLSSDLDDSFLKQLAGSNGLASASDLVAPRLGTVIDEKYRLESLCGRGGMGFVFGARHLASDRPVALKWMQRRGDVGELSKRFIGEARAAGRIRHPNVVDVYDVVATDDLTYLVMELLEGESLRKRLRRGRLTHAEAVELGAGVLSGLEEAHRRGVIHRDLKPENLFLCSEPAGRVKIVDFGISVVANADTAVGSQLTRAGQFVGTPSYTALERLRDSQPFDHRVDLYSVGVILYEALTGHLPFEAMSVSELTFQLATNDPTPLRTHLPTAPESLLQVIHRALERDPADRFPDARSFREALLNTVNPAHAAPPRRHAKKVTLAAVTLVALFVAGFSWSRDRGVKPTQVPTARVSPAVITPAAAGSSTAGAARPSIAERTFVIEAPPGLPAVAQAARAPALESKRAPKPAKIAAPPFEAAPSPVPDVTLRVVVFPYGDVWLDGRRVGSSPARISVPAGTHKVAGGRSNPERERSVDVRSGETRDVVLSWGEREDSKVSEPDGLLPRGAQLTERAVELEGAGVRAQ